MSISVVIPVLNRAAVVPRTLSSVLAQTHRPLELLLVDNHSTDGTLQVLQQFQAEHESPELRIKVLSEPHQTAGTARNCGLREATGDWVMFFDSDDVMQPTLVERYAQAIAASPSVDIVVCRGALYNEAGDLLQALPYVTRGDLMDGQLIHSTLATQRYIVRRKLISSLGGWNESLPGWNDWEMGVRLLAQQPRVHFLGNEVLVHVMHSGAASITGTEFHSRAGQWERVIDLNEQTIQASALKRKAHYLRLLNYRRLVLAAHYQREGCPALATPLRQQALAALHSRVVAPWLYRRIVAGRRGSGRIARWVF